MTRWWIHHCHPESHHLEMDPYHPLGPKSSSWRGSRWLKGQLRGGRPPGVCRKEGSHMQHLLNWNGWKHLPVLPTSDRAVATSAKEASFMLFVTLGKGNPNLAAEIEGWVNYWTPRLKADTDRVHSGRRLVSFWKVLIVPGNLPYGGHPRTVGEISLLNADGYISKCTDKIGKILKDLP